MRRRTITVTVDERATDDQFDTLMSHVGDLVVGARMTGLGNTDIARGEVHEVTFKWEELSDLDKGAVLMFLWKCENEGEDYARENYPVSFIEHPELVEMTQDEANDYALTFEDELEEGVPGDDDAGTEHQRLYNLALHRERA